MPVISWTKVGSSQPTTETLRNGSLWIKTIQKADEGRYRCLASNKVKTVTREITISVYSKSINNIVTLKIMSLVGIVDDLVACAADSVFCPRKRVRERRSREGITNPLAVSLLPSLHARTEKKHQLRSTNDLRS